MDFGTIARRGTRWVQLLHSRFHISHLYDWRVCACVREATTLWGGGGGSHPRRLCAVFFLLRHPVDDPRHPSSLSVCMMHSLATLHLHHLQASLPRLQDEERRLRAAIAASIAAAASDPAPLQDSSNRPGTSGGGSRPGTAGTLARPGTAATTACGTTARRSEWRMRMCLSSPTCVLHCAHPHIRVLLHRCCGQCDVPRGAVLYWGPGCVSHGSLHDVPIPPRGHGSGNES